MLARMFPLDQQVLLKHNKPVQLTLLRIKLI
uniref:Uncharacterized protein n=1 Tax=Picea sitchensis TaxID=3332 RepID=A0A6B9XVD4_PICSI|nr:hypothetical protein Q903MT_gene4314 [Picea sitchensis]